MNWPESDDDQVKVAFGLTLKAIRVAKVQTEEQFAAYLGWTPEDYNVLERGIGAATLHDMLYVARRVRLAPETFVSAMLTFLSLPRRPAALGLRQYQLYRLAWVDVDGTIHDAHNAAYDSVDTACADLPLRNVMRKAQGQPRLTRISAYVLLGHLLLSTCEAGEGGEADMRLRPSGPRPVSPIQTETHGEGETRQ